MKGRVLIVAGSDSGGGAGVQADIKTVTALGGYALTALTALTAQDTTGVKGIHPVPPEFVRLQLETGLADPGADIVKTGMLGGEATVRMVGDVLAPSGLRVVVDPVMTAKGGQTLLDEGAIANVKRCLLPMATLLTPNVPEAEALSGIRIASLADMRRAAEVLLTLGVPAVLLKGGHLPGEEVIDVLATPDGEVIFRAPRQRTAHTHGTGCTLASAIATGLAQGLSLTEAVRLGHRYVQAAIAAAPGYGVGHGPLNHSVWVQTDW